MLKSKNWKIASSLNINNQKSCLLKRSLATTSAGAKTTFGLSDNDRIFTNLYGRHDFKLKGMNKIKRYALNRTVFIIQEQ